MGMGQEYHAYGFLDYYNFLIIKGQIYSTRRKLIDHTIILFKPYDFISSTIKDVNCFAY